MTSTLKRVQAVYPWGQVYLNKPEVQAYGGT